VTIIMILARAVSGFFYLFNVCKEEIIMLDFYAGTFIGVLIGMFIKALLLTAKDADQRRRI